MGSNGRDRKRFQSALISVIMDCDRGESLVKNRGLMEPAPGTLAPSGGPFLLVGGRRASIAVAGDGKFGERGQFIGRGASHRLEY